MNIQQCVIRRLSTTCSTGITAGVNCTGIHAFVKCCMEILTLKIVCFKKICMVLKFRSFVWFTKFSVIDGQLHILKVHCYLVRYVLLGVIPQKVGCFLLLSAAPSPHRHAHKPCNAHSMCCVANISAIECCIECSMNIYNQYWYQAKHFSNSDCISDHLLT